MNLTRQKITQYMLKANAAGDTERVRQYQEYLDAHPDLPSGVDSAEGYAEALVDKMNRKLADSLNFKRWWTQDTDFREFFTADYTFIDENPVYIINFTPKGKKDFQGVMYVNTNDFAIVRLEFENVRPLKKFALFGITYRHSIYKGKMLFGKDPGGSYSPRYIELEDGHQAGVDRPLNVIEKNKFVKGRRKQNELALQMDIMTTSLQKYELVVFNTETISQSAFKSTAENPKVQATYLSEYNPDFWNGYTIMEPNAAIQAFRVIED